MSRNNSCTTIIVISERSLSRTGGILVALGASIGTPYGGACMLLGALTLTSSIWLAFKATNIPTARN